MGRHVDSAAAPGTAAMPPWQPPDRLDALGFWLRTRLLAARHALRESLQPSARRWPAADALVGAPVLAQQRTPLWTDGRADEFVLVAGKVQNLRVARRAFHGVEVPAGEVLSFWRQLGRPGAGRGFVPGREVREGCVVPTRAGGICQLSNALAGAAARAGFELVERHAHSARIAQAPAGDAGGIADATVFWNYIDLKLRAPHAWRLEVALTPDELVLTLRGHAASRARPVAVMPAGALRAAAPVARGCLSCDQADCFRHRPQSAPVQARTAVLLDGWAPEFAHYLQAHHAEADRFLPVPVRLAFWRSAGPAWPAAGAAYRARWAGLRRAVWQRRWAHEPGRRQASLIDGQRWLAAAYAARLTPLHTHLVVDQGLLAHLMRLGALDGRQVEVLAGALPMAAIEARLDAAARRWPQAASLRDFRIDPALAQAERQALARAAHVVTAHADVARHAGAFTAAPVTRLPWAMPVIAPRTDRQAGLPVVVFPASALARKGAHELAAALQGLPCRLRVLGTSPDGGAIWRGLAVEPADRRSDWLAGACAVVLPAHVEHAPRALLRALAAGVPVVATPACGLEAGAGVHTVEAGDVEGLRATLRALLPPAPGITG